jgi:hypothetical protein
VRATSQPIGAATAQQMIAEQPIEIGQRERAFGVGQAVQKQPRQRQHDQYAQNGGEAIEHGLGKIGAEFPRRGLGRHSDGHGRVSC